MSMPYPRGFEDRLDAIEQRLDQLFASIQTRSPVTQASAGLIFPSQGVPATPPSGGHLHAEGSEPYWKDAGGSNRKVIQDFPRADYVPNPPSFIVSSAPGTYQTAWAQDLRDAVAALNSTVTSVTNAMKSSGLMDPF